MSYLTTQLKIASSTSFVSANFSLNKGIGRVYQGKIFPLTKNVAQDLRQISFDTEFSTREENICSPFL